MTQPRIQVRRVTEADDPAQDGFISTYIDVFAGAPYFETFEADWVRTHVWEPHIAHCAIVAETEGEVVGLACSHPVLADTEPGIRSFLLSQNLPYDLAHSIFMSELAVRTEFRQNGLGLALIHARLQWGEQSGYSIFTMRTAQEGSNSKRLYKRLGAKMLPFVEDVSGGEIESSSKQRIYLFGPTSLHKKGNP